MSLLAERYQVNKSQRRIDRNRSKGKERTLVLHLEDQGGFFNVLDLSNHGSDFPSVVTTISSVYCFNNPEECFRIKNEIARYKSRRKFTKMSIVDKELESLLN